MIKQFGCPYPLSVAPSFLYANQAGYESIRTGQTVFKLAGNNKNIHDKNLSMACGRV